LCRPPGHHPGPRVFGGYCYFKNVAVAAEYLLSEGKVAIVGIDYDHGNGKQAFFDDIKSVFMASIQGQARDTNHNEPFPRGLNWNNTAKC
jgi:acetoin utilization deacetylase AcuC-like enzyme